MRSVLPNFVGPLWLSPWIEQVSTGAQIWCMPDDDPAAGWNRLVEDGFDDDIPFYGSPEKILNAKARRRKDRKEIFCM